MTEVYVGQVQGFAFDYAPVGWLQCDGRLLEIAKNATSFSLLGVRFGGDGSATFGLPDLGGKGKADGLNYCIAIEGLYPPRI